MKLLPFPLAGLLALSAVLRLQAGEPSVSTLANAPLDSKSAKSVQDAVAPAAEPNRWNFSAGYQYRQLGDVNWHTGSLAAQSSLPWLVDRPSRSSSPGSTAPPLGVGEHAYSDGYVNLDPGTATDGRTWYWGYNNASQLQGNNLAFHASVNSPTSSVTTAGSSASIRSSGWGDDLSGSGGFANIEAPAIFRAGPLRITLEAGYSYASSDTGHAAGDVFTEEQHSTTQTVRGGTTNVTDIYALPGGNFVAPSAPYAGTYAGPGAIIPNAPSSRSTSTTGGGGASSSSSLTALFHSDVSEGLSMRLHTISLGPRFSGNWDRLHAGLGVGLGLNIADWSANYQERLYLNQNGSASRLYKTYNASASGTDVLPGLYLDLTGQYDLTNHLGLFFGGRYDWAGSISEPVGPSHFDYSLHGWSVMGGVTISF